MQPNDLNSSDGLQESNINMMEAFLIISKDKKLNEDFETKLKDPTQLKCWRLWTSLDDLMEENETQQFRQKLQEIKKKYMEDVISLLFLFFYNIIFHFLKNDPF